MPNQKIFCNIPWYGLQIYWDGSLGFCCQESHKPYPENQSEYYNVKNISIAQWHNSDIMKQARLKMFGNDKTTFCTRCYQEEELSTPSRRPRENQKSAIFTKSNFNESYQQSPHWEIFEHSRRNHGDFDAMPVDLHIDLGNYCNLTCKMCGPKASSSIASQYVKWGIADAAQYIGTDWTKDDAVWNRVLNELASIPKLKNVHFMGGETLITKRFEDFVDFMITKKRFDLNFSFVTNATIFNQSLIDKLKKFQRVGIEISIESLTDHNTYQRQGTDTHQVLQTIDRYLEQCNGTNITLTARPAISALTIGSYYTLLEFCLERKLIVKSLVVFTPKFMDSRILPQSIREQYKIHYVNLIKKYNLEKIDTTVDYNESDPNQILPIIKNQVMQCLNLLNENCLPNSDLLLTELVAWCRKWDQVHGYNAVDLYPELKEVFVDNGY
jgi:organic radical activating enzyme